MAVIGKLPHQMGAPVPDQMQQIQQGVQKAEQNLQPIQQTAQPVIQQTTPVIPQTDPVTIQTEQQPQVQTSPAPNNGTWSMVLIALCLGAAAAMGASLFVIKSTRKVTN